MQPIKVVEIELLLKEEQLDSRSIAIFRLSALFIVNLGYALCCTTETAHSRKLIRFANKSFIVLTRETLEILSLDQKNYYRKGIDKSHKLLDDALTEKKSSRAIKDYERKIEEAQ